MKNKLEFFFLLIKSLESRIASQKITEKINQVYVTFRQITYRKGAHYKFECKVKRTALVDAFPFVDGRRPVTRLLGETETVFEMGR